ncbi:MAG: hypothetical protein AAGL69_12540 [Pseudomonadota bacterium]
MGHAELPDLLNRFESLEIAPGDFHHDDHVYVAFAMLEKYDYVTACTNYAKTIRKMAESVGVPEKFNATITFAFVSLIAERLTRTEGSGLTEFLEQNPDLLDASVLSQWYSKDRLTSATARRQFLLPDRVAASR